VPGVCAASRCDAVSISAAAARRGPVVGLGQPLGKERAHSALVVLNKWHSSLAEQHPCDNQAEHVASDLGRAAQAGGCGAMRGDAVSEFDVQCDEESVQVAITVGRCVEAVMPSCRHLKRW